MIRRDRARLRLAVRRKQYVQTYSRFGRDARTRLAIRLAARLARRQASGAQPDPRFPGQREPFRDVCVHEPRERFRRVRRPPMPITLTDDQIEAVRRSAAACSPPSLPLRRDRCARRRAGDRSRHRASRDRRGAAGAFRSATLRNCAQCATATLALMWIAARPCVVVSPVVVDRA